MSGTSENFAKYDLLTNFRENVMNFRIEVLHTAGYNCGHKLTSQNVPCLSGMLCGALTPLNWAATGFPFLPRVFLSFSFPFLSFPPLVLDLGSPPRVRSVTSKLGFLECSGGKPEVRQLAYFGFASGALKETQFRGDRAHPRGGA